MRRPMPMEDALVGALALYDENGDEEALVENVEAFLA